MYSYYTIPLTVPRCRYVPFSPLHIVAEVCPAHIIHQDKDYVGALLALLAFTSPKPAGKEEGQQPGHLSSWLERYWPGGVESYRCMEYMEGEFKKVKTYRNFLVAELLIMIAEPLPQKTFGII